MSTSTSTDAEIADDATVPFRELLLEHRRRHGNQATTTLLESVAGVSSAFKVPPELADAVTKALEEGLADASTDNGDDANDAARPRFSATAQDAGTDDDDTGTDDCAEAPQSLEDRLNTMAADEHTKRRRLATTSPAERMKAADAARRAADSAFRKPTTTK